MKGLIGLLFVSAPAAAQNMGGGMGGGMMQGGMGGGMMHPGMSMMHGGMMMQHPGAGHAAVALYVLVAVLGYWVLQHAAKETANHVKKTGATLGMLLVIIGLLGALCGIVNHAKMGMARQCKCHEAGMMQREQGEEMGEKNEMPAGHEKMMMKKAPEAEKKSK